MLSKSQYIRGLQCHKSLWLHKHSAHLKDKPSAQTEAMFNAGNTVGDHAKELFPGGVEIDFTPTDFEGMLKKTADMIDQGAETIYEATFKEKGVFAMADILHKTQEGWDVYEVKSSTTVKDHHLDDAAVQYYALNHVLNIHRVFIVHVNNQYVRDAALDIASLLTIEDVTVDVLERQQHMERHLFDMETMLASVEPCIDIGVHCSSPYACDFKGHCWQHIPEPSVFNLYRMNSKKKFELYYDGVVTYADIPVDYKLNTIQQLQIDASSTNEVTIDKDIIRSFLASIAYPISFFDFETFQNSVPRFDRQRPYMQIPFQYSLHIKEEGGNLLHYEYLGDENRDPRRELAERMLYDLPSSGSIVAYNQSFEISRIKELADLFPDLHDALIALVPRFVDLIVPFRQRGYYAPAFNGSFSIKSVLPALFPNDAELDYKKLTIQNGGMAMDIFAGLYLLKDATQRDEIRKNLLAYCYLDTLAMVRIWEKLVRLV